MTSLPAAMRKAATAMAISSSGSSTPSRISKRSGELSLMDLSFLIKVLLITMEPYCSVSSWVCARTASSACSPSSAASEEVGRSNLRTSSSPMWRCLDLSSNVSELTPKLATLARTERWRVLAAARVFFKVSFVLRSDGGRTGATLRSAIDRPFVRRSNVGVFFFVVPCFRVAVLVAVLVPLFRHESEKRFLVPCNVPWVFAVLAAAFAAASRSSSLWRSSFFLPAVLDEGGFVPKMSSSLFSLSAAS
mmetsp:Transcript_6986/g.11426  ORF Transcript_6986/g.11426 Transcript_6986/m.11426 type:complete len:248 (-) Transcript_6986:1148-1891(-)